MIFVMTRLDKGLAPNRHEAIAQKVILPEASFGLRVLSLPLSVCVSVCVCVYQSLACPRDNLLPLRAMIYGKPVVSC